MRRSNARKLPARPSAAPFCSPRRVYGWQGGASSHKPMDESSSTRAGIASMLPCEQASARTNAFRRPLSSGERTVFRQQGVASDVWRHWPSRVLVLIQDTAASAHEPEVSPRANVRIFESLECFFIIHVVSTCQGRHPKLALYTSFAAGLMSKARTTLAPSAAAWRP